jgi:predicted transcriptional regulator
LGYPVDESEPKIRDIVGLLSTIKSVAELEVGINIVFIRSLRKTIKKCYLTSYSISGCVSVIRDNCATKYLENICNDFVN